MRRGRLVDVPPTPWCVPDGKFLCALRRGRLVDGRRRFYLRLDKALPHPPSRMTLLARRPAILLKPAIDDRFPPIQLRRGSHRYLARLRHSRHQRRSHITAMNPEPARQLPDRHIRLNPPRSPDPLVQPDLRSTGHLPHIDPPKVGPNQKSTTAQSGAKPEEHTQCSRPTATCFYAP